MDSTDEEWRPVLDYEGRYEVSSHGRVRSTGFYSGNRWGTRTWRAGRVLRGVPAPPTGHLAVTLVDEQAQHRTVKVHRLVLLAFRGSPPEGQENGLHEDDDPTNNRLENLRWGTRSDNGHDAVRNGGHTQTRKSQCPRGHDLVEPNLVESTAELGYRACLSCKLAMACRAADNKIGRPRTRHNRGRDGFLRQFGETWEQEADRRYAHVMGLQRAHGLL